MNNLLISGVGKVGKKIYDLAESFGFSVICCIDKNRFEKVDCPIYSSFDEVKENIDLIIDFSSDDLCNQAIDYALKNKCAFLCGTTALSEKTLNKINELAKISPVCVASNFSKGVIVLNKLAETAINSLPEFDLELVEAHNRLKKDAPSGTAKRLAEHLSISKVHSLRGGDVAGVHTIYLFGNGEEIAITHRAYDKIIFARGALCVAVELLNKSAGFYLAEELLK